MISGLITLIIYLIIVGILLALVWYVLDSIPIPEPINRFIKIAVVVVACLVIIVILLNLLGGGVGGVDLPRLGT